MIRPSLRLFVFLPLLSLSACFITAGDDMYDSPASGMIKLGDQMKEKGDLPATIDFYQRGYAQDRKNLTVALRLAAALEESGDKKAAAEIYRDAVKIHPEDFELRRNYGRLSLILDMPSEALRQYEAALRIKSDDIKCLSGLGVALDHMGEHAKAQKQYKKVLQDEPYNLATLNNLAYSYILTRRYEAAIKELEPRLSSPDATPAMRQNLALAYGLAGRDEDAERVARIDLPEDKVKQNMDYYKRQRAELAVSVTPYAELGTYASEAQAVAQIERLRGAVSQVGGYLKPVVMPEVTSPGETPRFSVRMMGCSRPDDVKRLCTSLSNMDVPCVPKGKDME